jgi:hypothetical protein
MEGTDKEGADGGGSGIGIMSEELIYDDEDGTLDQRVHQNWKPAGKRGIVRAVVERPIEVSGEEAERTRGVLERLAELKERQARGGLNAGVEVELEL